MASITDLINSEDPLSDSNIIDLLLHFEEDSLVDYKLSLTISEEKEWLGITKDIMSFSNSLGGFLIFGVRDISFELIGLDEKTANILGDSINILQKINRFIEPEITNIRSKKFRYGDKLFVIVYIPETKNITHLFSKDGVFKYPSGQEKYEFRAGTFLVRRSGGNHLANSRDLDFIFTKRLTDYRDSIMDKIARVVEAPSESKIFIVSEEQNDAGIKKFIIDDSSDAIPVKGMSFTIEPQTVEQEIASFVSLNRRNPLNIPPRNTLWTWYSQRYSISLNIKQRCALAKFCLLSEVPFFYWLIDSKVEQIKDLLIDALEYRGDSSHYHRILLVANFLGIGIFNLILQKLGKRTERMAPSKIRFLKDDVFSLVNMGRLSKRNNKLSKETDEQYRNRLEKELNAIVTIMVTENPSNIGFMKSDDAIAFDCYLYANRNKYKS
ncbi:MAG: ATP-binding protein [Ignavibacteriaceae bacterium]